MKKIVLFIVLAALFALPSISFALLDESTSAFTGDGIEASDGEFRILALDEDTSPVVGEGIDIGDDEVKITSIEAPDTPVSSDYIETPVVGEDIKIGDDEAKIVSVDNSQEYSPINNTKLETQNTVKYYIIAVAVIAIAVIGVVYKKTTANR